MIGAEAAPLVGSGVLVPEGWVSLGRVFAAGSFRVFSYSPVGIFTSLSNKVMVPNKYEE
jgi:hypothetical protein